MNDSSRFSLRGRAERAFCVPRDSPGWRDRGNIHHQQARRHVTYRTHFALSCFLSDQTIAYLICVKVIHSAKGDPGNPPTPRLQRSEGFLAVLREMQRETTELQPDSVPGVLFLEQVQDLLGLVRGRLKLLQVIAVRRLRFVDLDSAGENERRAKSH